MIHYFSATPPLAAWRAPHLPLPKECLACRTSISTYPSFYDTKQLLIILPLNKKKI